ncbi:MAG: hypothetical protein Q4615_04865 [Paracoccus aminovorans]|nr:hypothetical protein [Paracoccus aminovorans]
MRPLPFPNCPRAVHDARALIANPERAAQLPRAIRTAAWHIAVSARNLKVRQRLREATNREGA